MLHQPSHAIKAALDRVGMEADAVNLFEINEAFAAVGIASTEDLGIDPEVVNINGGAIAMGHPWGCPETASLCTWRSSWHAAAAGPAPRLCAAAAAKATPSSFAR